MNFNFKNLSENTKRIRIIPKNNTELAANIGVDNPTAMIDEDGVFSVCLSPNETPTNACDGGVVAAYIPQSSDGDISSGWGYQQIVINGTAYSPDGSSSTLPPLPLGLLSIGEGRTAYEIEVGSYNYLYFATFENLTAEDLRIELIGIQDAEGHALTVEEQLTLIANPNPTVIVDYSAQKATFCLAKNELL